MPGDSLNKRPWTWRRRLRWAGLLLLALVPALIPPSSNYDPAPLLKSLSGSLGASPRGPLGGPASLIVRGVRRPGSTHVIALRIEQGRITRIAEDVGDDLPVLDGQGRYVIPGLFDSHVHLSLTPGATLRGDDAKVSAELRAWHMRAYLASGVTSILDPAIDAAVARDIRDRRAAGHVGPRFFTLGPPIPARDGYVEDLFPPGYADVDQDRIGAHLDRLSALSAQGVKVPLEPGMLAPIWNVHSQAMLDTIRKEAQARRLPIYVHAMSQRTYALGLRLSPHAFVHLPETLDPETLGRLVASRAYVMTTLAAYDGQRTLQDPSAFADAHSAQTIPPIELQTLRSPAMQHRFLVDMIGELLPMVPGRYRDLLASLGTTRAGQSLMSRMIDGRLRSAGQTLLQLQRAGVPLVMGSDAGNWPVFPFFFHGPTTWREISLLEGLGLSPTDVLRAATETPARMLGVDGELGSIAVGQRADLLLLDADPALGLSRALPSLHTVIFDGLAHRPAEWMELK